MALLEHTEAEAAPSIDPAGWGQSDVRRVVVRLIGRRGAPGRCGAEPRRCARARTQRRRRARAPGRRVAARRRPARPARRASSRSTCCTVTGRPRREPADRWAAARDPPGARLRRPLRSLALELRGASMIQSGPSPVSMRSVPSRGSVSDVVTRRTVFPSISASGPGEPCLEVEAPGAHLAMDLGAGWPSRRGDSRRRTPPHTSPLPRSAGPRGRRPPAAQAPAATAPGRARRASGCSVGKVDLLGHRPRALRQDRPGVEVVVHQVVRHPELGVALANGPRERVRAAVAGQHARVPVDDAELGDREHLRRQPPAVADAEPEPRLVHPREALEARLGVGDADIQPGRARPRRVRGSVRATPRRRRPAAAA